MGTAGKLGGVAGWLRRTCPAGMFCVVGGGDCTTTPPAAPPTASATATGRNGGGGRELLRLKRERRVPVEN